MGIIDIIIICCFLPSLYFGAKNGFVKQVVSLIIIILGIKLSISFSPAVAQWLGGRIEIEPYFVTLISFVVVFVAVALVFALVEKLLDSVIRITMLEWLNRLLGIVFSLAKVALLLSLAVYFVNSANELLEFIPEEKLAESRFFKQLLDLSQWIFPALKSLIQEQQISDAVTIVS